MTLRSRYWYLVAIAVVFQMLVEAEARAEAVSNPESTSQPTANIGSSRTIAQASGPIATSNASEGRWGYHPRGQPAVVWDGETADDQRHRRLCNALLKRLNSFHWSAKKALNYEGAWDAIASFPGFSEPPWEPLNIAEHKSLLVKLARYEQVGPDAYFGRISLPSRYQPPEIYVNRANALITEGWSLQILRSPLLTVKTEDGTYKRPVQTILNRRKQRVTEEYQPGFPPADPWQNHISIVTTDLDGPDPAISPGAAAITGPSSLMIFEGSPYFVNYYSVWYPGPVHEVHQACEFEFKPNSKRRK